MASDKRVFTLRLDDELYNKLKYIADKNKRSMNGQIEFLAEKCVDEFERENGEIKIKEGR